MIKSHIYATVISLIIQNKLFSLTCLAMCISRKFIILKYWKEQHAVDMATEHIILTDQSLQEMRKKPFIIKWQCGIELW